MGLSWSAYAGFLILGTVHVDSFLSILFVRGIDVWLQHCHPRIVGDWLVFWYLDYGSLFLAFSESHSFIFCWCCFLSFSLQPIRRLFFIIFVIIIITWEFFTKVVFHWILSDCKSVQASKTLFGTLVVHNNVVICMVSTWPPTSKSSSLFNNPSVTVPNAPITIVWSGMRQREERGGRFSYPSVSESTGTKTDR